MVKHHFFCNKFNLIYLKTTYYLSSNITFRNKILFLKIIYEHKFTWTYIKSILFIAKVSKCAAYKECLCMVIVLKTCVLLGVSVIQSALHCCTGSALFWTSTRLIESFVLLKSQRFHRSLQWILRVIKPLLREGSAFTSSWYSSKGLEFGFHPPLGACSHL